MKILQIVSSPPFTWSTGGPARVAWGISTKLVGMGHEVSIYSVDKKDKYSTNIPRKEIKQGVEIYRFKNISNKHLGTHLSFSPKIYKKMKEIKEEFDIVHIHDYRTFQAIMAYRQCMKRKMSYIIQAHGSLPINNNKILKKSFDLIFGYRILKNATKVIALNTTEKEEYIKMGLKESIIEILPNGIDLSNYENLPKKGNFRSKYDIKDDQKMILYLGRITKTKGIDLLLKSFADVKSELKNVKLIIVGPDDGYKKELVKLIKNLDIDSEVVFTGFVSSEEKMQALVDADVSVTPKFTGFPVTFVESCASGTPIITTTDADNLDWIHNKVGYVVNYDKNELTDAILKILNDEKIRNRFSDEGKNIVKNEFNWKRIAKRLEKIYSQIKS